MGKIISVVNQKGGVGKTTTAVNLAAAVGIAGKKVLVVDADPQGNTTSGYGVAKKRVNVSTYELLVGTGKIENAIIETGFEKVDIVPASIDLAAAELDLIEIENRQNQLKMALATVRDKYDYIFIDCPPSLGLITINSLNASDTVLVPIQCEYFALEGLSQLTGTVKKVRQHYNPNLSITGILLTMYNGRLNLTAGVVRELKKYYADKLFKEPISRSVRLSEAPSYGEPICYHEPYGKGALEYQAVAKELLTRI